MNSPMNTNFEYFGGIPRYVFSTESGTREYLIQLESKVLLTDIRMLSGETDSTISHMIFQRDTVTATLAHMSARGDQPGQG